MSEVPSITIYACGGTGINMARAFVRNEPTLKDAVTIVRLDSSNSNVMAGESLNKVVPDGAASGAGKIRETIVNHAQQYISNARQETLKPSDVNIVLFSMSGGTGSVVGPLLIRKLTNQGHQAVALTVSGYESQLDIENSIRTVQSLDKICDAGNIYLPLQVFDNYFKRENVNVTLPHRLSLTIQILIQETREIDGKDRLNWLNGTKTSGATSGIKTMHVVVGNRDEDPNSGEVWFGTNNDIVDAVLDIGIDNETDTSQPSYVVAGRGIKSRVRYDGIFTQSLAPMLGIIGTNKGSLIEYLDERKNGYNAQDLLVL